MEIIKRAKLEQLCCLTLLNPKSPCCSWPSSPSPPHSGLFATESFFSGVKPIFFITLMPSTSKRFKTRVKEEASGANYVSTGIAPLSTHFREQLFTILVQIKNKVSFCF